MPQLHHVTHDIEIDAPRETVFSLLLEATDWPQILSPTIHVERLEHGESEERLQIWARANDDIRCWTSKRTFDQLLLRIGFAQERTSHPVASMEGRWSMQVGDRAQTRLVLDHWYRVIDDDPSDLRWLEQATDSNSRSELAAIQAVAERACADADAGTRFAFDDTVIMDGAVEDTYEFLWDAGSWPDRLDHVASVELTTPAPDVQGLRMRTRAPDGSTHSTHSFRVGQHPTSIAYKQTETPPLLRAHTGCWTITPGPGHTSVTSQHTVTINPDSIVPVLGVGATLDDAKRYVRNALSANSLKTLSVAQSWVENRAALSVGHPR